jgi:hypothetical protein
MRQYLLDLQRLATDAVFERHAFQILHRYKRLTILLPDFVDRADVRMVQCRRSTSFTPKALQRLWVFCKIIGKKFQGNEAPKLGVFGFVNDTHPAAAQLLDDPVMRDDQPDHGAQAGMVWATKR